MPSRRSSRCQALVLGRTKLAEQDVILTLLSEGGRQVRAIAKGGRKPGSRLAARTELFCEVDLVLSSGRGLPIVTEAEVIDAHTGLRGDLGILSCASALAEVARMTCLEEVEDAFLYPLARRALTALAEADDEAHRSLCLAAYVFKVMAHGGWRPELTYCLGCGEETVTHFSPSAGGVLCASCASGVEGVEEMSADEAAWVRSLIGLTFDALLALSIDPHTAGYLLSLSHRWARTHLESRLRAFEFCLGI